MEFQGTVITIWGPKGGVGATTILASLLRKKVVKFSTPKKTVSITYSIYSRAILSRTGVKTDNIEVNDSSEFNNLLDDLSKQNNNSKKFKKYTHVFIDCGNSICDETTPNEYFKNSNLFSKLIQVSDIIIGVFTPDANHRETQQRFENAIFKNNTEKKHVLLILNHTKPNYGENTQNNTIKYIDQMCEKYSLLKPNETMGYSKLIELEDKALDTKSCRGALSWLAENIKNYSNK